MHRSPEPATRPLRHAAVFAALANPPHVVRTETGFQCELRVPVDAAAEVMVGHYPGIPIMPGVLIIDVLSQLLPYIGPGTLRITAIERVRYVNPLLPGDELLLTLAVAEKPAAQEFTSMVRVLRSDGSAAADIRLRLVWAHA